MPLPNLNPVSAVALTILLMAGTAFSQDRQRPPEWSARQRLARVNLDMFADLDRPVGRRFKANFFRGAARRITITGQHFTGEAGYRAWYGRTAGSELDNVVIVKRDGLISMDVYEPDGVTYRVRSIFDDLVLIEKAPPSEEAPPCAPQAVPMLTSSANLPAPQYVCNNGSEVDLLVVYTRQARLDRASLMSVYALQAMLNSWGLSGADDQDSSTDLNHDGITSVVDFFLILAQWHSEDHVRLAIDTAVEAANLSFHNSDIPLRLTLAHTAEIDDLESATDCYGSLWRLRNGSGAAMQEVHELREMYEADIVSLLTTVCGGGSAFVMADPTHDTESWAFNVVNENPDMRFLLAHEIGHNFGCCHGPGDSAGCPPGAGVFPYSHGYRFSAEDRQYRTVMTYLPGTMIPHFSTPEVTYAGHPTGGAEEDIFEADNARTIREMAFKVSNYRGKCREDFDDRR